MKVLFVSYNQKWNVYYNIYKQNIEYVQQNFDKYLWLKEKPFIPIKYFFNRFTRIYELLSLIGFPAQSPKVKNLLYNATRKININVPQLQSRCQNIIIYLNYSRTSIL